MKSAILTDTPVKQDLKPEVKKKKKADKTNKKKINKSKTVWLKYGTLYKNLSGIRKILKYKKNIKTAINTLKSTNIKKWAFCNFQENKSKKISDENFRSKNYLQTVILILCKK